MRALFFLFIGILAASCMPAVGYLNANSNELFCAGAQNMITYIHANNKLPRYSDSSFYILPEMILSGVPPEFKNKLLNQEMKLRKHRGRRKQFTIECSTRLELKGYDLSRYYYDYDTAVQIIALVVVKENTQYQKDEWIYFYGLLDSKGEIIKQDEFHWIDQKGKF